MTSSSVANYQHERKMHQSIAWVRLILVAYISGTAVQGKFGKYLKLDPPPHEDVAKMARYIVHVSDWAAMATISTRSPIDTFPFANIFSVSDGTKKKSRGTPYMYLTDLEMSVKDIIVDNRASLTMTLAQTPYCRKHSYDPESPLCAHVVLTGNVVKIDSSSKENVIAKKALFSRHPEMVDWPNDHGWWFGKLNITQVCVLDYFGGAKYPTLEEYFAADPTM